MTVGAIMTLLLLLQPVGLRLAIGLYRCAQYNYECEPERLALEEGVALKIKDCKKYNRDTDPI